MWRLPQPVQIGGGGIEGGDDIDADAHLIEQALHLLDVVAVAEAQRPAGPIRFAVTSGRAVHRGRPAALTS